jgi:hypothetical protein
MEPEIEARYEGILDAYFPEPMPGELEAASERFKSSLGEALRAVGETFFTLPVAGGEKERVFERRFTYELYRQIMNRFEAERFNFAIGPEIDKRAHPIVRTNAIPDLIVHRAGSMMWNLCVIEVKPISGAKPGFEKDVRNLRSFVQLDGYRDAVFIVYGPIDSASEVIQEKIGCDFASLRKSGVRILWQASAGASIAEF